jgi:hypothetical protein
MTAAGHGHADRKPRRLHDQRRFAGASARCRAGALDCTMGLWYLSITYIAYQVNRAHMEVPIDTGLLACTADEAARVYPIISGIYAVRNRARLVLAVKTGARMSEGLSACVGDGWPYGPCAERVAVSPRSMRDTPETALAISLMAMLRTGGGSPETSCSPSTKGLNQPQRLGHARHRLRQPNAACGLSGHLITQTRRTVVEQTAGETSRRDLLKTPRAMSHQSPVASLPIDARNSDAPALEARTVS